MVMKNFCPDLIEAKFIVKGSAKCWFTDFEAYLTKQNLKLPLDEKVFNTNLLKWVGSTNEGKLAK